MSSICAGVVPDELITDFNSMIDVDVDRCLNVMSMAPLVVLFTREKVYCLEQTKYTIGILGRVFPPIVLKFMFNIPEEDLISEDNLKSWSKQKGIAISEGTVWLNRDDLPRHNGRHGKIKEVESEAGTATVTKVRPPSVDYYLFEVALIEDIKLHWMNTELSNINLISAANRLGFKSLFNDYTDEKLRLYRNQLKPKLIKRFIIFDTTPKNKVWFIIGMSTHEIVGKYPISEIGKLYIESVGWKVHPDGRDIILPTVHNHDDDPPHIVGSKEQWNTNDSRFKLQLDQCLTAKALYVRSTKENNNESQKWPCPGLPSCHQPDQLGNI
jgi:hypothetical protein